MIYFPAPLADITHTDITPGLLPTICAISNRPDGPGLPLWFSDNDIGYASINFSFTWGFPLAQHGGLIASAFAFQYLDEV